ncbi:MAG: peptide chain release factor N(5)-glutamine methyltransferase [Firmicutes bacterium]|nr:peptide chain release factor N(5)-glutamine methyltransferase [Bacillota bacterium]
MGQQLNEWQRLLRWASSVLQAAGIPEAAQEAHLLLLRVAKTTPELLYAHPPALSPAVVAQYRRWVKARAGGMPFAYLVGEREFMGLSLRVTPSVLIPRPETETLVEAALKAIANPQACVVDVGTGCGAVALALRRFGPPGWRILGVDVSEPALEVARANARRLGLGVEWRRSDLLSAVVEPLDGVVANLPYIAAGDPRAGPELRFEPALALYGPAAGRGLLRRLVAEAHQRLKPGGWLGMEMAPDEVEEIAGELKRWGYRAVAVMRDLSGQPRVVHGVRGGESKWQRP